VSETPQLDVVKEPRAAGSWLLPDDLTPEELAELLADATLVLAAVLWPCELPDEPYPPPIEVAIGVVASRLYAYGKTGEGQTVVSESLGSYSYRLSEAMTAEGAALVPTSVLKLIEPWNCRKSVYEISIAGGPLGWPVDWWQRNLDNVVKARDEALLVEVEA
jgi:hypothetical protein